MSEKPDICIYHMPCQDGFAAAWAIWKRWPDIEFVGAKYGDAPPNVKDRHVLIVDFSYKHDVLVSLGYEAASITILDHHKSAQADLAPFSVEELVDRDKLTDGEWCSQHTGLPVQALFDMGRSGAAMAWEYAHQELPIPIMIQHVQDRDLWQFNLGGTREITADLFSLPYDFETFDKFAQGMESVTGRTLHVVSGEAIMRKHDKDVSELLSLCERRMKIGGHIVPVANLPYTLSSDGAGKLAEGNRFGACYYDNKDGQRVFSLRSRSDGEDVSVIAASYGGGGHARAAGFTAPKGWEGDA